MAEWIEDLATSLQVTPLTVEETRDILSAARDVAHQEERRLTPLATFLAGVHAGRAMAGGTSAHEAVASAITGLRARLSPGDPGDPA